MARLLAGHILNDGEVVQLILKPSLWFIVLSSLNFAGVVGVLAGLGLLYDAQLPGHWHRKLELATIAVVARLMWATLEWMGRLYVLTDYRILRLSGVFTTNLFDCPLRKVARTRLVYATRERLFRLGTIEIVPAEHELDFAQWQMVSRPRKVHEIVRATVARAKQGGHGHA